MITFEPLKPEHFPYLLKWLQNPVVKKWYDSDTEYTLQLIEEKYLSYTKGYKIDEHGQQKKIAAFIVFHSQNPMGYIQLYNAYDFSRKPLLTDLPTSLGAIDFFIGEDSYRGRGLGSQILHQFINLHVTHFEYFFVDPSSENLGAIKCYHNAAFYPVRQGTSHWLLRCSDPCLQSICQKIVATYRPLAIILYGSRARGDHTEKSDYDILVLLEDPIEKHMACFNEEYQSYEDIFLSYDNQERPIREDERRFIDGLCLYDMAGHGAHFLGKIREHFSQSQAVQPLEKNNRILWHQKMLARSEQNDIEGKYRRIWLIYALLEDYFVLRDLPYEGPKKSFKYLNERDKKTFALFDTILSNSNTEDLRRLISYVTPS